MFYVSPNTVESTRHAVSLVINALLFVVSNQPLFSITIVLSNIILATRISRPACTNHIALGLPQFENFYITIHHRHQFFQNFYARHTPDYLRMTEQSDIDQSITQCINGTASVCLRINQHYNVHRV